MNNTTHTGDETRHTGGCLCGGVRYEVREKSDYYEIADALPKMAGWD